MDDSDKPRRSGFRGDQVDRELEPDEADRSGDRTPDELTDDVSNLMIQVLEQTRMAICVVDPHQPDCPIVSVNQAFVDLTGYGRAEIIGRNCRFLQGVETDPVQIDRFRDAMRDEKVRVIELLNYRKDGSAFWNSVHIGPLFDKDHRLTHFYGSQWDVSDLVAERERFALQSEVADEIQHRTANLFSVIGAIVRLTARDENVDRAATSKILDRIRALQVSHETTISSASKDKPDEMLRLMQVTLAPYRSEHHDPIRIAGPPTMLPPRIVTALGLSLHELVTNAVKYGALSTRAGRIDLAWRHEPDQLVVTWTETGGPALDGAPEVRGTGIGSRIVASVIEGAGGEIAHDWRETGLVATLRLPLT